KGEVHLFDVIGFRIEYNGEIVALTYSTDITQLNASIEKERLAEEFNRKLLDNAPSFMEFWDVDCNIFSCNQRMLDVFGVSNKTEFLERYYDFSPKYQPCGTLSPEKNKQMIEGARKNGRNRCEWTYILRNGEEMPVDSYFVSTTYQDTPIIICYSYDLRPIKAAMEKEHIAEEENRAKTRFLARMSHEIRTPMNAILGITETQLQKNMPAETEEAFLRIHSSSNFLLTIINDILDLSKVEAEKMEIVPAPYDITNMIVDTVQLNMVHIGNKPINFSLEVDPQIPTTLIGDELRIKQILNNMLSNAFKYTQEGQVKLSFGREASEKSVEESVEKSETIVLVVQVQDTGVGMTKEQIDKLFNVEFTRFNTPGTRAIEGSGLGMTITHRFIKLMQGTIEVNSDVGKGSIFTARIPQKFQVDSLLGTDTVKKLQNFEITQKSMKKIEKLTQDSMPYGRVLVVDDMEMNLYVAESLLEPYQISVETAVNGNGAIEKIKSGKEYDIIFMDHMMPDMDGLETTKIIRRLGYTQPIIALTANVVNSVFDLFINSGFDDIISKPINLDKFNSCLIRYIKNKHQEKGLD
ncbi:MAG: response regulator, partial [Treponema sp.]|nr:response regulator [Treponema sp.]